MFNSFRLFVAVVIALSGFAGAQTPSDPDLQLRMTMRNTGGTLVEDFSGKGQFAFLGGAAFFQADAMMSDSVAVIDGSGQVSVQHSPDLEPARGTVETWIKVDAITRAELFYKVTSKTLRTDRRNGVGGAVYGARILEDGSVQAFILNDDPAKNEWTFLASPRTVIKAGTWHHVALQWDGKFTRLFVDGVAVAKQPYREIPGVGLSYYGETAFELAPGESFVGQFGETRIYSRPLTEDEVAGHYAQTYTQSAGRRSK